MLFLGCENSFEEQAFPSPRMINQSFNVLLDGDSRTDGWNCTEEYPYIDLLHLGDSVEVSKVSYGGATIRELLEREKEFYRQNFDSSSRANILIIWIGANDLNVNNEKGGEVYKNLVRYCYKRKTEGWDVIVCTEISINGGLTNDYDIQRLIYNQLINLTWRGFADRLADLGKIPELGPLGSNKDSDYFCDGVHLTNQGTHLVASIIQQAILKQIGRPQSVWVWGK